MLKKFCLKCQPSLAGWGEEGVGGGQIFENEKNLKKLFLNSHSLFIYNNIILFTDKNCIIHGNTCMQACTQADMMHMQMCSYTHI